MATISKRGAWTALAGCGVAIALTGYQRWTDRRQPEIVVGKFVDALKSGDQEAALELLAGTQEAAARQSVAKHIADWVPSPDLRCVVQRVEISDDFAVVQVSLIEQGYALQPEIALDRDASGNWKISAIGKVQADPRWTRDQRQRQAEADERLARDLESSLKDLPGVLVERERTTSTRRL